jgi:hypothetical protein
MVRGVLLLEALGGGRYRTSLPDRPESRGELVMNRD